MGWGMIFHRGGINLRTLYVVLAIFSIAATVFLAPIKKQEVLSLESEIDSSIMTLAGKKISVDAGHQSTTIRDTAPMGPGETERRYMRMSLGAKGKLKYEYEVNLEIAQKLKEALIAKGADVLMIREKNDVVIDNVQRAEMSNNSDIAIKIHCDAFDDQSANGITVLVPGQKYIQDKTVIEQSAYAGELILEQLIAATGAYSRGVKERDNLLEFNWSTVPVVLVECGFITHVGEEKLLNMPSYQERLADAIVLGLENYFNE